MRGRVVLAVAAAMGSAAAVQQALTVRDRGRYPAPGVLVQVDGHQMTSRFAGLTPVDRQSSSRRGWVRSHRTGIGFSRSLLQRSEALLMTVPASAGAGVAAGRGTRRRLP